MNMISTMSNSCATTGNKNSKLKRKTHCSSQYRGINSGTDTLYFYFYFYFYFTCEDQPLTITLDSAKLSGV